MSLIEDLKLALTGDRKALEKIEEGILKNSLSHEEINHVQQLVTDNNLKSNSHAYYLAGLTYQRAKNYAQAAALYDQAIVLGNTDAMNRRAFMYFRGKGGPIDYAKAIALYEKAVALGNPEAMINRADMHSYGHGGPVDYAKAIALYEKAIALGSSTAMYNRGQMHCVGQGGPIDYAKGIALYEKAITLDNARAMNNRAFMHIYGQGGPIDYDKAIRLFDKAIALDNTDAMNNRAFMHLRGYGGPLDYSKAIALLDRAIVLGDAAATSNRAILHHKGEGGPVDHNAAAYLYRKAYFLEKNNENLEVAKTHLRPLTSKTPRAKYHWAMLAGKMEVTRLIKQDPQNFLCFLAEDDLLFNTEKYHYVKQILKQDPYIKTKIINQVSIALLEEYIKAQASNDNDSQVSSLMSIDASIWQYLVTYLSRADKASLRLVSQFFLRHVLSSPLIWEQWVEVNQLEAFQQQGKRFGWGPRHIYGVFYSPYSTCPESLPPDFTALDLSRCEKLFKMNSVELIDTFTRLPKQLTYLKLQYARNVTQPVISFLLQNYPDLYIDFAGNNLLFWASYFGWQDIVTRLLEQVSSQKGPFARLKLDPSTLPQSERGDNTRKEDFTPLSVQKQLAHTKQWIHKTTKKIGRNYREAWHMAFRINVWLEYLALTPFSFSLEFSMQNAQLFALALIDIYVKEKGLLQNTTLNLQEVEGFSQQKIDLLTTEMHALKLQHVVTLEPILKTLEKILLQLPQIKQIKAMAWNLLYACDLTFFSTLAEKETMCAAILAVARFQILKNQEEVWPNEYVIKTKMTFESFKKEYELISKIGPLILKTIMPQKQGGFFASTDSIPSNQQADDVAELKNDLVRGNKTNGISCQ